MGEVARIKFGQSLETGVERREIDSDDPDESSIEDLVRGAVEATLIMRDKARRYSEGQVDIGQVADSIGRLDDYSRRLTLGEQAFVLVAADVEYADRLLNPPDTSNVHDINERRK
jgi:hypothetical protein